MRALINSFIKPSNRIQRTYANSVKKIYFWKTVINMAAKSILVQLCYYMTREFSSTFSRINHQTAIPTEKCFKLLKSRAAVTVKKKIKHNQHRSPSSLSMKTLRFFWGYWIIVTGPLEILNWRSEMLRMCTPEKKPLGCLLNLNLVLEDV